MKSFQRSGILKPLNGPNKYRPGYECVTFWHCISQLCPWKNGGVDVMLSHYILDELQRVLPRLNHRVEWSHQDIQDFIDSLAFLADIVEPLTAKEQKLRDEADQPVLGTLLASRANYLITGDKDLLALSSNYPILSPAQFWQLHGG